MKTSTDPQDIDILGPTSPVEIVWKDGHQSSYNLEYLRRNCPCAICTGHGAVALEERMSRKLPENAARVKSIQETGNYALHITWGDGHASGYYAFEHLRSICPCHECQLERPGSWEI